ncbi:hypothetical protein C8Q80DRAFT_1122973 [Daedaleopsis nitida]|nr:hypothetical protein C8Q80DRAFT_1122973 [Daedaleopsis nitida]
MAGTRTQGRPSIRAQLHHSRSVAISNWNKHVRATYNSGHGSIARAYIYPVSGDRPRLLLIPTSFANTSTGAEGWLEVIEWERWFPLGLKAERLVAVQDTTFALSNEYAILSTQMVTNSPVNMPGDLDIRHAASHALQVFILRNEGRMLSRRSFRVGATRGESPRTVAVPVVDFKSRDRARYAHLLYYISVMHDHESKLGWRWYMMHDSCLHGCSTYLLPAALSTTTFGGHPVVTTHKNTYRCHGIGRCTIQHHYVLHADTVKKESHTSGLPPLRSLLLVDFRQERDQLLRSGAAMLDECCHTMTASKFTAFSFHMTSTLDVWIWNDLSLGSEQEPGLRYHRPFSSGSRGRELSLSGVVSEAVTCFGNDLDDVSQHDWDFRMPYFSLRSLMQSCLLTSGSNVLERPQFMYMRVAIAIRGFDRNAVLATYAGTEDTEYSSCFIYQPRPDSMKTLLASASEIDDLWLVGGGVGMYLSRREYLGDLVQLSPVAVLVDRLSGPSGCPYGILMFEHSSFDAASVSRSEDPKSVTLFDPQDIPDLDRVCGDQFDVLYKKYEHASVDKMVVHASELFRDICEAQKETGTPFIIYEDAVNGRCAPDSHRPKSNQKHNGFIWGANLCTEIVQYSDVGQPAVCTLVSISLPAFLRLDMTFDFNVLHELTKIAVFNMDMLIDRASYPSSSTCLSAQRHRALGVGVQGLADCLRAMFIVFGSEDARCFTRDVLESIYHAALEASCDVGLTSNSRTLRLSWGVPLSDQYDWGMLQDRVLNSGLRNALVTAQMPTATTSHFLGNSKGTELWTSNIVNHQVRGGKLTKLCYWLVRDLEHVGLWNIEVRDATLCDHASVAAIPEISDNIKVMYQTAWEIDPLQVIEMAAIRSPFIDQSESLTLYIPWPDSVVLLYAWGRGLKTGIYYLRMRAPTFPFPWGLPVPTALVPAGGEVSRRNVAVGTLSSPASDTTEWVSVGDAILPDHVRPSTRRAATEYDYLLIESCPPSRNPLIVPLIVPDKTDTSPRSSALDRHARSQSVPARRGDATNTGRTIITSDVPLGDMPLTNPPPPSGPILVAASTTEDSKHDKPPPLEPVIAPIDNGQLLRDVHFAEDLRSVPTEEAIFATVHPQGRPSVPLSGSIPVLHAPVTMPTLDARDIVTEKVASSGTGCVGDALGLESGVLLHIDPFVPTERTRDEDVLSLTNGTVTPPSKLRPIHRAMPFAVHVNQGVTVRTSSTVLASGEPSQAPS